MRSYVYSDVQSCLIYLSVDMICIDNLTTKPSIGCVQGNVRKRVFATGGRGGAAGVSGTYHPPGSATVSTE